MRRGRIFIYLALVLLVVLAGAFLFLRSQTASIEEAAPAQVFVDIVIAQQNIPQGGEITDEALGKISLPEGTDFGVMFQYDQRETLLVGKFAKYPIEQGVVITQPMIGGAGIAALTGPDWASSNSISSGMTAISIPVSRLSSVAYGTADGARVNVIACFLFVDVDAGYQSVLPNNASIIGVGAQENTTSIVISDPAQGRVELEPALNQPFYVTPSEAQRPRLVCQTIVQDVSVLRLGNFPVGETDAPTTPADDEEAAPAAPAAPTPPNPDMVTLVVSPQDATSLTYMMYGGAKLTLTLRGTGDISRTDTEAATLQFLLSQYAIPIPAKLHYAFGTRIDALVEPATLENAATSSP